MAEVTKCSGVVLIVMITINFACSKHVDPIRHHKHFSRYTTAELAKHEYNTDAENHPKSNWSRFRKLDKLLYSIPMSGRKSATPKPKDATSAPVSGWAPAPDHDQMADDFLIDQLAEDSTLKSPTSTESLDWDNHINYNLEPISQDIKKVKHHRWSLEKKDQQWEESQGTFWTLTPAVPSANPKPIKEVKPPTSFEILPAEGNKVTRVDKPKSIATQPKINAEEEAELHFTRMNTETACKTPVPKVIHVSDVHPHPSKKYIPLCTNLHRCARDTGCCEDVTKVCTNLTSEIVSLHFHVLVGNEMTQEVLQFYNHTQCGCKEKKSKTSNTVPPLVPAPALNCKCPQKFSARLLPGGMCVCDCFHMDKDCIKLKKGKSYFSAEDQLCIKTAACHPPSCQFGYYLDQHARCILEKEIFSKWPKHSTYYVGN